VASFDGVIPSSHAKLVRNQGKFQTAQNNFRSSNVRVEEQIKNTVEKCDEVLVSLTIRFTKEIELRFYDEQLELFTRMEGIEKKFMEIAHVELGGVSDLADLKPEIGGDPFGAGGNESLVQGSSPSTHQ